MRTTHGKKSQRVKVEAASDLPSGITVLIDDQPDVISIYLDEHLTPAELARMLEAALNKTVTSWQRLPKPGRGSVRSSAS